MSGARVGYRRSLDRTESPLAVPKWRSTRVAAGRDPSAITIGLQSVVCLADTAEQARERLENSTFELFRTSLKDTMMKGVDLYKYVADNLIGTPDEVCAKVAAFEEGRAGRVLRHVVRRQHRRRNAGADATFRQIRAARVPRSGSVMTAQHCDVLVVGAGPVGLAAAAELRRRNIAVRCVDAAEHHNVSTKALGLQARTLELFERLGVVDEAVARGLPVRKFNIMSEEHRIAEFDMGGLDTPYPYLLMLPQNLTEEILRDRFEQLGGIVEHGTELVGFGQDADGVDAILRYDGHTEGVRAGWLIAADGAHSTVRHGLGCTSRVGGSARISPSPTSGSTGSLPMDELFAFLNHGNFIAYFPMAGGWYRVAIAHNTTPAPPGEVTLAEVQDAIDMCGPRGACAVRSVTDHAS